MNTTNNEEQKIREICTYSGDEGTSGYLLSEKQFEQIFSLIRSERSSVRRETIQEIRKFLEESSVWDTNYIYIRKAKLVEEFNKEFTNLDTISHDTN